MLFPVCSPDLVASGHTLRGPSDLNEEILLHDSVWHDDWARWMRQAGAGDVDPAKGTTFSLYSLALQVAIDGGGVLMGHAPLVAAAIGDGRLVAPFAPRLRSRSLLTLLVPEAPEPRSGLAGIIEWFRDEAAAAESCVASTPTAR